MTKTLSLLHPESGRGASLSCTSAWGLLHPKSRQGTAGQLAPTFSLSVLISFLSSLLRSFPGASAVGREEWKMSSFPGQSAACNGHGRPHSRDQQVHETEVPPTSPHCNRQQTSEQPASPGRSSPRQTWDPRL